MRKITIFFLLLISAEIMAQSKVSEVKSIATDVHGVWLDQYENKSILIEFDKFMVLTEFPQNDSVAKDIIAKSAEMFPKKPIKYVLHSHHHSHSISSFDPFLHLTKASLVTTQYNFEEIKKITTDTLLLKQRVIVFDSIYTIKDKRNQIDCFNILQSEYLVPTKEYMVFYLPKQQTLISGCLLNKPISYFEVVNARKPALKKIITDKKLSVTLFIPTNTSRANGFEDVISMELFEEALVKGIVPNDFCDDFQSKSIEYLESKTDSLLLEFRKTPRSFDYLVCANTLSGIRKDYNRAIIIFKIITTLYPEEAIPFYYIAECYEAKGADIEAIAFYQKFMNLTEITEYKEIALSNIKRLTN